MNDGSPDTSDGPADPPDAAPRHDAAARRPGFHWMDIVMALDALAITYLFGALLLDAVGLLQGTETPVITEADLWANNALLMVMFGVVPFVWIWLTRRERRGVVAYFRLERPWQNLGIGALGGVGIVLVFVVIGLIVDAFGYTPENPGTEALGPLLTWPLVLATSIAAGFGEEVLFRGVLQKHIGWIGQALLFGALHAYQGLFAVLLITGLALLFGYAIRRGMSLWVTIGAHTSFDLIQLSLVKIASGLEGV